MPEVEEFLCLDLLTLREHTELAGDMLDADLQRRAIEQSLAISEVATVRRAGALVAYAMLQPQDAGCWFVTGFNTHPAHRTAPVFRDLFAQIAAIAARRGITTLRSNVYKTNRLSMAFHQKLGFKVTRENAKGVEFTAELAELKLPHPRKQNLLFVCSKNQWRSPTAEQVWRRHPGLCVRSAGTSHQARHTVSEDDVRWADIIFAMEDKHRARLKAEFRALLVDKPLHVLDIPDEYRYMDPELVALLRQSVAAKLGWSD